MRSSSAFYASDFEIFGCSMNSGRKFFDLSRPSACLVVLRARKTCFGIDLDEIAEVRGWNTVDGDCRTTERNADN
jgi:hypothetical protein